MESLDVLHDVIVALHIVSAAAIVGGWFAHFKNPTVTASQWWGSLGMVVTGVILFGWAMLGGGDPNHMKLGIKILVLIAIGGLALAFLRKPTAPRWINPALVGLVIVNLGLAVLWT